MIKKLAKELRRQRRGSLSLPLKLGKSSESPGQATGSAGEGTTFDVSESGLGIFSGKEMEPGALLEIDCRDLWDIPRVFEVRWCSKISFNFYRAGLALKK